MTCKPQQLGTKASPWFLNHFLKFTLLTKYTHFNALLDTNFTYVCPMNHTPEDSLMAVPFTIPPGKDYCDLYHQRFILTDL